MKFQATFSNGKTVNFVSNRAITHAYLVTNQWQSFTGFSSSEALAKKAASADSKYGTLEHIEIIEVIAVNS